MSLLVVAMLITGFLPVTGVLAGSVSLALAYKRSSGDVTHRASLSVTLSLIISISMASDALVWYGTIADGMQG